MPMPMRQSRPPSATRDQPLGGADRDERTGMSDVRARRAARPGTALRAVDELAARVRLAVEAMRAADPAVDDPFRGLYLSEEEVLALLDRPPSGGPGAPAVDADRLGLLATRFDLTAFDVEILVVALAPDVDARFERFYGYLHDDVTRRRATIGLAFGLAGVAPSDPVARGRVAPGAPLIDGGLVVVEEPERPFLSRSLAVPERVTAWCLGDEGVDWQVEGASWPVEPRRGAEADRLAVVLRRGSGLLYLRERPGAAGADLAAGVLAAAGLSPLVVDVRSFGVEEDPLGAVRHLAREARLLGAGLALGPVDALVPRALGALRMLADASLPLVLFGAEAWDPAWARRVPAQVEVVPPDALEQAAIWTGALGEAGPALAEALPGYRLAGWQVRRAAVAARQVALLGGGELGEAELRQGAAQQSAGGLTRLARRIDPAVGWGDLVLAPGVVRQLRELVERARLRGRVLGEWRMRPGGGRGTGVVALFAGDPGTGKTMSAEVIAGALGLELYAVNLATVVDKYVGETEKNLERIFVEAAGVNGLLLFDEADALFGKRSEVRDAHDRYANVETSYLLQRLESFDGLAVLSTNLRANLDEAFTRRLDLVIEFPEPDVRLRRELWDRCLGSVLPRAADVDLDFCARAFSLSGGGIRSASITAAYLAAAEGGPVRMAQLVRGAYLEYRKAGRLTLESDFGPWLAEVVG